jgi:flagellar basal body-associated protein FliL
MAAKKNKRGDIPITILVLGVIVICTLAMYSFISSTNKVRNSFVGIGLVEKLNSQIESKIFNNENPGGLYLEKRSDNGILFWKKDVLLFSVEYKASP